LKEGVLPIYRPMSRDNGFIVAALPTFEGTLISGCFRAPQSVNRRIQYRSLVYFDKYEKHPATCGSSNQVVSEKLNV
jgi:hypothetical protein